MRTIEDLTGKIERGEPFVFSRFGDGEWNAILGLRAGKANTDGHAYYPDMGKRLGRVLEGKPDYFLGLQGLAMRVMGDKITAWLDARGLRFDWLESEMFHRAAVAGNWSFKDAFAEREYTYVGPAHLRGVFPNGKYIEIPQKNCWLDTARIVERIISDMTDTVGFSGSMAAKVWIDMVHRARPDATLVDFGSVFDPLAGVKSRKYMR